MAKTLPSGDVLHAVHEDIGKANRDLDKKLVTKIANELETSHEDQLVRNLKGNCRGHSLYSPYW